MPNILFRADADLKSGTGDLLSLMYLSEYFEGWNSFFVTRETEVARALMKNYNIGEVKYLDRHLDIKKEIKAINDFILEKKIDAFFLEVTSRPSYLYEMIRAPFRACIDFYGEIPKDFDLVINWDVVSDALYDTEKHPKTKFLLGPHYAILKKDLIAKQCKQNRNTASVKRKTKRILIFFGGFDEFDFTGKAIRALKGIESSIDLTVVTGAGYHLGDGIKEYLKNSSFSSYRIKRNVSDMCREYDRCDFAVISGGLSLFEAIAREVPAAVVALYRHQVKRSRFFEKAGCVSYLGFRDCRPSKLKDTIFKKKYQSCRQAFSVEAITGSVNERFNN